MVAEMVRLPLPEPGDDAHPLDWYPGDEPESRTIEEAEAWVDEVLTRRGDLIKLHEAPQALATPTGPNTTNLTREIVMPSHDIAPSTLAAIQVAARAIQSFPKRERRPVKSWGVRRNTKRGAHLLPMIYVMQCTDCGLVKIGCSGDYRLRRVELEKQTGHTLDVLGIEFGGLQEESWTHWRFRAHRVRGEWYRPADEILTYAREQMSIPWEKRS